MSATSKKFSLSISDWSKGLFITVFTSFISSLIAALTPDKFIDIRLGIRTVLTVGIVSGLSAGLTYIFKQYITNSDGQMFKKERRKD